MTTDYATNWLMESRERVRQMYGAAVGRHRSEVVTPALMLDLPAAKRNISKMGDMMRELPADLRPHIKVHKSPELAELQVAAGAIGLSCATVWEAAVLIAAGLDHVFVVNTIAGPEKIRALAMLARSADVMVAVDDPSNIDALSIACQDAGSQLGVLVEIDTGMDRAGADGAEEALDLARRVQARGSLRMMGLTGYEGHCSITPETDLRHARQRAAMEMLIETADHLISNGIPCPILSAGGTATWAWTGEDPRITEIQAGSYVVMDVVHSAMAPEFEVALTVAATVISRRPERVILDAGNKSVGTPALARLVGFDLVAQRFDEEHGLFKADLSVELKVGDVVQVIPGYAPSTVNWFDAYHVMEDEVVVDVWPVVPRGPGHHGLG